MRSFNKEELTKICRFILYNTDVVVEKKYSKFLIENVFNRHPNWVHKRGVGIKHIEVRNNKYNQKSFYIVRTDGSETDISFVKSITYPNKISRIMRACRTSVLPEILKIRNNIKLPFVCPITGETINDKHLIHIDHYDLTFEDLFYKWLDGKNIDELYEKTLKSKEDNNIEPYFDDDEINKDFLEFHNNHTHLRVVSKTANLSILRKK